MASPLYVREAGHVEDQLQVRQLGVDGFPQGELVTPDGTSVWPMVTTIDEVWLHSDDRTLVVVGLRIPSTVLQALDIEESSAHVSLLAWHAFPLETAALDGGAQRTAGAHSSRNAVAHRGALAKRPGRTPDRRSGPWERRSHDLNRGESVSDQALARLRLELRAARTPAQRRRNPPDDQGDPAEPAQGVAATGRGWSRDRKVPPIGGSTGLCECGRPIRAR